MKNVLSADDIEYRVPSGNGDGSIVCHLHSAETGILKDCMLLFTCRKYSNSDCHSERFCNSPEVAEYYFSAIDGLA